VTGLEEFDEFALDAGISGGFAVLEVVHLAFEERVVLEKIEDAEWGAADGEDIHSAVAVAFYDGADFRGAADASQAFGHGKKHAEFGFLAKQSFTMVR